MEAMAQKLQAIWVVRKLLLSVQPPTHQPWEYNKSMCRGNCSHVIIHYSEHACPFVSLPPPKGLGFHLFEQHTEMPEIQALPLVGRSSQVLRTIKIFLAPGKSLPVKVANTF